MNLFDASIQLAELLQTSRIVFVKTVPDVLDFTSSSPTKLEVCGPASKVELEVTPQNIHSLAGILDATIFDKDQVDRIYFWNIKSLSSFVRFHTTKFVTPKCSLIDLKPIEGFLGVHKPSPENLYEASNRAKIISQNKDWQAIYKSIHLPLSLRVLPSIEATALLNDETRRPEYPYYDVEGQINGRLNCSKKFSQSYLPHNLGPDVRQVMKPRGYNLRFLSADFRFCEVAVLQWLSQDPKLKELLDSGADLHSRIYEIVTENSCDTDTKRNISKKMFLPVVYGLGAAGLAHSLGLSESMGQELHNRIYNNFGTALEWVENHQRLAKDGPVKDYFGRPRSFPADKCYLVRNFVVQAVAATLCQEKLIELWKALNGTDAQIVFSVHDGYVMVCPVGIAKETYQIVKETLEAESKLCPGLRMKVEIKFGARLSAMKVLWKD